MSKLSTKHFIGLEHATPDDIQLIIDTALTFREILDRPIKKVPSLKGKNIVNLFFENSTRTKLSFELAEKRLSADVLNFSSNSSSLNKGESLRDTVQNIQAMKIDCAVMRHPVPGSCKQLTKYLDCPIVNAGDGTHEHPTQAMLDMTSIYEKFGKIKKYEDLFDECKKTKNVNYFGYLENKKIIALLKKMHFFTYPSIWPETSCIAAIEAMAAGCEVVTTNFGALIETCSPFATFVNFDRNFDNLEKKYSNVLSERIKNFWSSENQNRLKRQSEVINATYSWDVRSNEWINFFNKIRK